MANDTRKDERDMDPPAEYINAPAVNITGRLITPENRFTEKPEIMAPARTGAYPASFLLPGKATPIPPEIKHIGPSYVPFRAANTVRWI